MSIELTCSSCAKRLRLNDKLAGKKIKCPDCRSILSVPRVSAVAATLPVPAAQAPSAPVPKSPADLWHVQTGEGDLYGPVDKNELDNWVAEGRIDAQCQILREGSDQWQWADAIYPYLSDGAEDLPVPSAESAAPEADTAKLDVRLVGKFRDVPAESPAGLNGGDKTSLTPASAQRRKGKIVAGRKTVRSAAAEGELSDRSKFIAGLLGLFLGTLGLHRIYLGYVPIGLIMLFTLGGCGVWSLIDAIRILMGKVPDVHGRPLRP